MDFQKVIFSTILSILLCCQVLFAAPVSSQDEVNSQLNAYPSLISKVLSSLRNNDLAPIIRHKRYSIFQIHKHKGHTDAAPRRLGARRFRFHQFSHHQRQHSGVKKI